VCNRPLKNPIYRKIGMGKICAAKKAIEDSMKREREHDDSRLDDDIRNGIIIRRSPSGQVETNVPHRHTHHSPTGYEYGYAGSGPADLALNCIAAILAELNYKGERVYEFDKPWDGTRPFKFAYAYHQDFKFQFIAPLDPKAAHVIPFAIVKDWVKTKLTEFETMQYDLRANDSSIDPDDDRGY